MTASIFTKKIINLNFSFLSRKEQSGVLLTHDFLNINESLASPDILFALEKAKKFEADAVYFRFFQDGRAATPQLYFFDYTVKTLTVDKKNEIHIRMWNGYQVPAYIIIERSSVSIFDSREKPQMDKAVYASEILKQTGDAIKSFNAQSFDDGLFWEEQEKKHFKFEQSAASDLIRGLKGVHESFQKKSGLNKHVSLKLLVQSLLVKYLEERDEVSASGYFAGTYFKRNFQCDNFCDTIRSGKLLDLLDKLSDDFNGKIFEWSKETEQNERAAIRNTSVQQLANYLDANIRDSQFVLWRLYSFSYLPVEVISSVYEELLTDSKDIVYTPEMIVSTLVDECMPLKAPQQNFKLIDVSCGSGIFLVKAYKRIVQWWRYDQWLKTGDLPKPSLTILKNLLLKSIYGVDVEQDAIRLSIFSLALGILDEVNLDPPTWGKLRFPDLSENIITKDFFKYIVESPLGEFNLVIGNPPFNLKQENGKEPVRKNYFKNLEKEVGYKSEISIPDENPALHFLVQSMKLLKDSALLCLIQPAVPILYQKDISFRVDFFSSYNLLQIIDFTKLSNKLWGERTVATVALFVQKQLPNNDDVLHLVANNFSVNNDRLFLEFDHYDFNTVSKDDVLYSLNVWKANLLGGGRISQLLDRMSSLTTLKEFIKYREKDGWKKGEGFIENKNGKPSVYITGKAYIPSSALLNNQILKNKITTCTVSRFHRQTNKLIYTPPHLLLRANIGKDGLIVHLSDEYLVFRNKIIGIHAPEEYRSELSDMLKYLQTNSNLFRFLILATSSQIKVSRHTVPMTEDFMDLPYSTNPNDLKISFAESILIKDVLKNQLSKNDFFIKSQGEDLKDFSNIFCQTLNSIYQSEGKSFQLFKILDAGRYYALHFEYSKEIFKSLNETTEDLDEYIRYIIPERQDNQQSHHIQRIVKAYGQDCIILAKPKQLRYWLPSIALRDADETFSDYIKTRYAYA